LPAGEADRAFGACRAMTELVRAIRPVGDRMSIFGELKRRNIFCIAITYLAAAWPVTEVAGTVRPAFGYGDSELRVIIILLALGLIPVLVASWVFEITPEGLKQDVIDLRLCDSAKSVIKPNHRFFSDQHRDDHCDEDRHPVERSGEIDVVTECHVDRCENHELRTEQDGPGTEEAEEFRNGPCFGIEIRTDPMLDRQGQLEQDLQKKCRQKRNRERVDDHVVRIFDEQVQNGQVDENRSEIAIEQPLPRVGRLCGGYAGDVVSHQLFILLY
jgi:hypothetical protein